MLISKKNNKGFTLVEVIVSMLVLSIVISSVLTAFSLSAKSNAKTEKLQSAESLMEDLMELAGAVQDSEKYVDTCISVFPTGTKESPQDVSATEKKWPITGIKKGSFTYDVDITINTAPVDYETMNNEEVLSFGESDKATVLIDASVNSYLLGGHSENTYDKMAIDYFEMLRNDKINADNALLSEGAETTPPVEEDTIRALIDRDVYLEATETPSGKVLLTGYFSYELGGSLDIGGVSRVIEHQFFPAQEFSRPGTGTAGDEELGRVYLLFSPFSGENRGATGNYDVRIWDTTGELLDADIYIIYQESSIQSITGASGEVLLGQSLAERYFGQDEKKVDVSFAKRGASERSPKRVDLYSPTQITCGSVLNVSSHGEQMIPESLKERVHEITIEIKDSDGTVLATETLASLQ